MRQEKASFQVALFWGELRREIKRLPLFEIGLVFERLDHEGPCANPSKHGSRQGPGWRAYWMWRWFRSTWVL